MTKKKKAGRVFLSKGVSIEPDLYEATVARARELRMNWSEYVRRCIEQDIGSGGDLRISPSGKKRPPGSF